MRFVIPVVVAAAVLGSCASAQVVGSDGGSPRSLSGEVARSTPHQRFNVVERQGGEYVLVYNPSDSPPREISTSRGGRDGWANFVFAVDFYNEPNFTVVNVPAGQPITVIEGDPSLVSSEVGAVVFEHGLEFTRATEMRVELKVGETCYTGFLAKSTGLNDLDLCS